MNVKELLPRDLPAVLTSAELAELLSVSVMTVHRWSANGNLPIPYRVGPRVLRWKTAEVRLALRRRQDLVSAAEWREAVASGQLVEE